MAVGVRFVSDSLAVMRRTLGRRNENDPDSSDEIFLKYINDFFSLKMPSDVKLFESFGTLTFIIDGSNATGVYTFNDVGADQDFINIGQEAFISLLDPVGGSISWNVLPIYQDPGQFFAIWGINNEDILIRGYPTNMLFYGNEFTFRTIPQDDPMTSYMIKIYGYKKNKDFPAPNVPLDFDYWMRYIGTGAAVDYAYDFRYEDAALNKIKASFDRERKTLLERTHNQIKNQRCLPRF